MAAYAEDLPLFPEPQRWSEVPDLGDRVNVRFAWGDEQGSLVCFRKDGGFPMATVDLDGGDRVSVSVARLSKVDA